MDDILGLYGDVTPRSAREPPRLVVERGDNNSKLLSTFLSYWLRFKLSPVSSRLMSTTWNVPFGVDVPEKKGHQAQD